MTSRKTSPILPDNPFVVEHPEDLTWDQLAALFVPEHTQVEVLKERKHTFLWGSRGSGKSMMLRYLEPLCQGVAHGGLEGLLESAGVFLGVYCPCKEGQVNKTDLKLLTEDAATVITEHMLVLLVLDRTLTCLRTQFPDAFLDVADLRELARQAVGFFDRASIASSVDEASTHANVQDEPLVWLQELIAAESRKISNYLRLNSLRGEKAVYDGAITGYHDLLLPFLKAVQTIGKLGRAPIYILLDDADRLTQIQQQVINRWVANRDHVTLCLKVSSQPDGWLTWLTPSRGRIEEPHDYSEVDTDELYTRSKSDYAQKVELISQRRLELSRLRTQSIEEFLPTDPGEDRLFEEVRRDTEAEWEPAGKPGRKRDFVYRYATARLFQRLSTAKQRKSYAGFQNIVHLSSGVVRDFLEPCYQMFDRLVSSGQAVEDIESIPPVIQNDVLFRYSEDFLLLRPEQIRKDLPPEQWTNLEALVNLLHSLGKLFYERLHDPDAREARLFSFTVRGQFTDGLRETLDLGVRYRYFQMKTYSTKEGGGRERWYILNRRLCPVFKLDPSGFEGRISLTPELLKVACEDTERFVRLRLKQEAQLAGQAPLFSLVEGE